MIEGIAGVIIWTNNLERMTDFYKNTLEFPVHSARPHFVAFEWGKMRFSIGAHDRVHGPAPDPHRIMINLAVVDIHRTHETLSHRGAAFLRPPERESWGGWVATFTDPDGNILQLLQQPEAGSNPGQQPRYGPSS